MPFEKTALGSTGSLAVNTGIRLGSVDCRRARTVSITCRVTYGQATDPVRVNLYFAADGTHFDTVPYGYFDVNITAGATVQETHTFDFPEHGYMDVEVYNEDDALAVTNVMVFDTVVKWGEL